MRKTAGSTIGKTAIRVLPAIQDEYTGDTIRACRRWKTNPARDRIRIRALFYAELSIPESVKMVSDPFVFALYMVNKPFYNGFVHVIAEFNGRAVLIEFTHKFANRCLEGFMYFPVPLITGVVALKLERFFVREVLDRVFDKKIKRLAKFVRIAPVHASADEFAYKFK